MPTLQYKKIATQLCLLFILLQYATGITFFFTQGLLINDIIYKDRDTKEIFFMLALMVAFKMLMISANVVIENVKAYYSNKELDYQFAKNFPREIFKDYVEKSSVYFQCFNDNVPRFFNSALSILTNQFTFFVMATFYIGFMVYTKFLLGGIFLALLSLSVFINEKLSNKKINTLMEDIESNKRGVLVWMSEYFHGYKETSRVWPALIRNISWFEEIYQRYKSLKEKLLIYFFKKNLGSQFLIEFPFVLATSAILLGLYFGKLSLPLVFAWLGISQFVLTATQSLAKNSELKKNLSSSKKILQDFLAELDHHSAIKTSLVANQKTEYQFLLQNGSPVTLAITPGIYPINGENGAGKTTLLDTLLSFDRTSTFNTDNNMYAIKTLINFSNIYVIDRNSVVFSDMHTFEEQISGPKTLLVNKNTDVFLKIRQNLEPVIGQELSNQWLTALQTLRDVFDKRARPSLSLGEKILLSCARNWYAWHSDIKILILDESDSSLDKKNKILLLQTIEQLSQTVAIYLVSHHLQPKLLTELS